MAHVGNLVSFSIIVLFLLLVSNPFHYLFCVPTCKSRMKEPWKAVKFSADDIRFAKTQVMDLTSMKYMRLILGLLNLWPLPPPGVTEPKRPYLSYFQIIHGFICWVFGFAYIVSHFRILPFIEIGHTYITSTLFIVFLSRLPLGLLKSYRDVTRDFTTNIHLFNIKDRSTYAMEIHIFINKITYMLAMYTLSVMIFGTTLFNITPVVDNYITGMYSNDESRNITKKIRHAVYLEIPLLNPDKSFVYYCVYTLYTWIVGYATIDGVFFIDLYMSYMVLHLWGRFKILIHELDTFPLPQAITEHGNSVRDVTYYPEAYMYSKAEMLLVNEKLKECITCHYDLMTFVDNMSSLFGPVLFVYNTFHLVSCCLLLLECSQMDTRSFALYGPITIVLFQHMMELSCVFELLGSVSEQVKDAVYNLPWECMNKGGRLTVLIFLMKVQEPVRVKALGMVNIGVTNMAAILKTSFSYFAFLRTVAD